MEWVIVNPSSIHEVCGLLGYVSSTTGEYCIKTETCGDALDNLLSKLNADGPSLKIRRSLGISQVIRKDLLPLLIAATTTQQSPRNVSKIIKLLSNLTSPIEILVPDDFSRTEEGQQVVYELDSLLRGIKSEFSDFKATQAVIDYLRYLTNQREILLPEECEDVADVLLLLRNILHIPQKNLQVQNQILWNLFAHNLDKIILHLMTCKQKDVWVITLVQLIALIYKDQHVTNLQKLLNLWLENSMSESSEDNESNTSPPDTEGSCDFSSSPMLTSDPTSDSSDNGGRILIGDGNGGLPKDTIENNNNKCGKTTATVKNVNVSQMVVSEAANATTSFRHPYPLSHPQQSKCYTKAKSKNKNKSGNSQHSKERMSDADSGISSMISTSQSSNEISQTVTGIKIEGDNVSPGYIYIKPEKIYKQECCATCTSTSSNEDEGQQRVPSSVCTKQRDRNSKLISNHVKQSRVFLRSSPTITAQDKQEIKRKKLHKRSKRIRKNKKAFVHHNPTEEDISHVLREFTVDFLLKGYGPLVANLQEQLSKNAMIQIDKSHFLWLITYFLKFATQLELDLEHIRDVLSYKMLSYLVFEGITMCEKFSLCKGDIKPHLRRMHLVVTALREFIQTVELYSKMQSYSHEDSEYLFKLRNDMLHVEELRYLFLLLIRQFKPGVQSKQYLQDLISTNHTVLLFFEKVSKNPEYQGNFKMAEFIKEFSSPLIMQQYGHLLEDFSKNGLFINDCIFTMMHHVAGSSIACPEALFQPLILKTFSKIWETEFEIRDDWADLIEYVIHRFMKASSDEKKDVFKSGTSNISDESGWSKGDIERLYWFYSNCANCSDPIAKILESYSDNGKTRESVLNQLLHQRIIGYNQFLLFLAAERLETGDKNDDLSNCSSCNKSAGISSSALALTDQLRQGINLSGASGNLENQIQFSQTSSNMSMLNLDARITDELVNQIVGEGQDLHWIQKQVLEACYVKLTMEHCNPELMESEYNIRNNNDKDYSNDSNAIMEPTPYHYCLLGNSIPIVPWTDRQEILLMSPPYLLLLHKLGFHLPADVGKRFPRIPHFWTPDVLYTVAKKLGPIPSKELLKFDPSCLTDIFHMNRHVVDVVSASMKVTHTLGISISEKTLRTLPGIGLGGANNFAQRYQSSHENPVADVQSINWMNVVHKSKQVLDRYSEGVLSSASSMSSSSDSEHMDDCTSSKALPPTDQSEDITMMSEESDVGEVAVGPNAKSR